MNQFLPKPGQKFRAYDGKIETAQHYLIKTSSGLKQTTNQKEVSRENLVAVVAASGSALDISEIKPI